MSDYYTWSGFTTAVTGMLTVDGTRAGLETFRTAMIRQGVIDLQNSIDGYRIGHETLYLASDLVTEGRASRGVKPPQSAIQDVWLCQTRCQDETATNVETILPSPGTQFPQEGVLEYTGLTIGSWYRWDCGVVQLTFTCGTNTFTSFGDHVFLATATTATIIGEPGLDYDGSLYVRTTLVPNGHLAMGCIRYPTDPWNWDDRFALINGRVAVNNGHARFCMDPQGYTFYVYPQVFDCWMVSVHWTGLKLDFQNDEETPFDEPSAMAVAEFVKGKIAREVDRDIVLHDSYMRSYTLAKQKCFVAGKERRGIRRA